MKTFSASDAAFEGFRVIRNNPLAILLWAVVSLIFSLGNLFMVSTMLGGFTGMTAANPQDPAATLAMFAHMAPFFLVSFVIAILLNAVYAAAVFRAVLRPQERSFGYLRLGGDEFRLIGLTLIYIGLFILFYLVLVIVLIVPAAFGGGLLAGLHGQKTGAAGMGGLFLAIVAAYVAILLAIVWLAVRLSLAAVQTFAERRIRVFGSWRLTKGKFWSLLGCYLLTLVMTIVVAIVALIVTVAIGAILGGGSTIAAQIMARMRGDMSALATAVTPLILVQTAISSLFAALYRPIWMAPMAAAYRDLTAKDTVADVF